MPHPVIRRVLLAATALPTLAWATPVKVVPTALLQYDWAQVEPDQQPSKSEDGVRRARLGVRISSADQRWLVVVDHDFSGRTTSDAFVEWTPSAGQSFRLGQFKQPFTLEDAISDKQSAFPEPSPVGAFTIGRRIGVEYARWGERGTLNVAAFGQQLNGSNDSPGASLRGTWRVAAEGGGSVHVGFSLATEWPRAERAAFALNPGTVLVNDKPVLTGTLGGVDRIDRMAVEGLWLWGSWSAQAEVAQVGVRRELGDVRGTAGGIQLTWSPTGDGRQYKRGVAAGPTPTGHVGWELALRLGMVDLDDGPVRGGHAQTWGLAATCYPMRYVRVIANLQHTDSHRQGLGQQWLTAGLRVQFSY
ncbi:MAG: hypothetical protein IT472_09595 [Thermomonas sp.]|uniref:OprO/OprP family phosphate-selective porin n=1 Tax=Thermomonas sp. TaxID=1971895 RepID=UPI00261F8865|nr:porin [Thermomonas sp.]MCC7097417.1 hypothetical protein [Thermomonas sp.]